MRKRLPATRPSRTGKIEFGNLDIYVTVSFYPDLDRDSVRGPAEIFVRASKHGSDTQLFIEGWATAVSIGLQYDIPWATYREKCLHTRGGSDDPTHGSFLHAIATMVDSLTGEYRDEMKGE